MLIQLEEQFRVGVPDFISPQQANLIGGKLDRSASPNN